MIENLLVGVGGFVVWATAVWLAHWFAGVILGRIGD